MAQRKQAARRTTGATHIEAARRQALRRRARNPGQHPVPAARHAVAPRLGRRHGHGPHHLRRRRRRRRIRDQAQRTRLHLGHGGEGRRRR